MFDRPVEEPLAWLFDEDADETIAALDLDSPGGVPWWPGERDEVPLHKVMVHCTAELNRHCGQADIVRELIDGSAGMRADNSNLPPGNWEQAHRKRLDQIARDAASR